MAKISVPSECEAIIAVLSGFAWAGGRHATIGSFGVSETQAIIVVGDATTWGRLDYPRGSAIGRRPARGGGRSALMHHGAGWRASAAGFSSQSMKHSEGVLLRTQLLFEFIPASAPTCTASSTSRPARSTARPWTCVTPSVVTLPATEGLQVLF